MKEVKDKEEEEKKKGRKKGKREVDSRY